MMISIVSDNIIHKIIAEICTVIIKIMVLLCLIERIILFVTFDKYMKRGGALLHEGMF